MTDIISKVIGGIEFHISKKYWNDLIANIVMRRMNEEDILIEKIDDKDKKIVLKNASIENITKDDLITELLFINTRGVKKSDNFLFIEYFNNKYDTYQFIGNEQN